MAKYTDDEIRNMKKITCKIAGDYLGISSMSAAALALVRQAEKAALKKISKL